jgi:hypothetical protein
MTDLTVKIGKGLKSRWEQLNSKKTTILKHCEKYAAWTLPYMFPPENNQPQDELPVDIDAVGAQGVNHLSNKIISTLFPSKSLFFRLHIDQETKDLMSKALQVASGGLTAADDLKAQLETQLLAAQDLLQSAENRAEDHLDFVQYRPQAINAMKLLIITGNALMFHPEDGLPVQVYNLRNYHVVRDCSGEPVEIMTREKRAYATFHPDIKDKLQANARFRAMHKAAGDTSKDSYEDDTEVCIYTQICLEDDGKFHVYQYADEILLDNSRTYTKRTLRWIPLVWNLVQGEDYGRGLVQDYAGAFHSLIVLQSALLNIAAVMGDIKFFIKPSSLIDVVAVQNSLPGSYHEGDWQEIGTPQVSKLADAQFIQSQIEMYRKQIGTVMMLTTQVTRDAERVTAEEIRQQVDELESSNSGIYSRMAAGWQVQTAYLALLDTGFTGIGDGVEPTVITGMDSLSRAGEAANLRAFMTDLAMLQAVPPEMIQAIKKPAFIKQIAQYHQVNYEAWVMTDAELKAEQEREMQQQAQLQQQQVDGQGQVEAVKAAGKAAQQ